MNVEANLEEAIRCLELASSFYSGCQGFKSDSVFLSLLSEEIKSGGFVCFTIKEDGSVSYDGVLETSRVGGQYIDVPIREVKKTSVEHIKQSFENGNNTSDVIDAIVDSLKVSKPDLILLGVDGVMRIENENKKRKILENLLKEQK